MKTRIGNLIIRIGFALLFIWGGLEKFIEGFLGGVGLQNMADFLKESGLAFLGDTGTYALGALLALLELIAGILLLINKQTFFAYTFLAFVMLMALVLVHIPSGNWMNIMIHVALTTTLAGLAMQEKQSVTI
ncbi:DoxX family membrane protein [Bizionia argentinensis JUB59]|uniref:DoxX family membrane protein n=1 Tax=Bizionia argentinensis JUB59 TaxID=1046627 RepID=G2EAM0_9FLAO|nr:DoxX family membrane protein [Bizionia argentinensis]EGV44514.1 DoxX family membrane protein [Bizionia argentinensis JUB59]